MNQVRVGIVGTGRMGQRHCRIFSNLRKVQLVGIHDIDPAIGYRVAKHYELPYYESLEELLDQVDAVSLATPTQMHFSHAMLCVSKGLHALVEKPIAATLEEAEELASAAEKSNLVVQVGHIERFNPVYMELKHILDIYQPLAITIQRLSPFHGSNKDVDVVLDLMIHDTHLIHDLIGRTPTKLSAFGLTAYSGTIDHAIAQLCFESGPLVTMTASRMTEEKIRKIDVTSREAFLECDMLTKSILIHRSTVGEYRNSNKRGVQYRQEGIVERITIPTFEPLFLQLQHFVDCILEGKMPYVTARDGYTSLKLATQIRDSVLSELVDMERRRSARMEMQRSMISPVTSS